MVRNNALELQKALGVQDSAPCPAFLLQHVFIPCCSDCDSQLWMWAPLFSAAMPGWLNNRCTPAGPWTSDRNESRRLQTVAYTTNKPPSTLFQAPTVDKRELPNKQAHGLSFSWSSHAHNCMPNLIMLIDQQFFEILIRVSEQSEWWVFMPSH